VLPPVIKLMRPKQWVKNVFVFPPVLFSGSFLEAETLLSIGTAFFLFCVASSATYILNDLGDIDADRLHPTKRFTRPLAAGTVSKRTAQILLLGLYSILVGAIIYTPNLMLVIGAYIALNWAYSLYLKHQPVLDIFTIAVGFVLRVYAGAVAIDVPLSGWMFVTAMCLALYLASIKRRQELINSGEQARGVLKQYNLNLIDRYAEMSATGALMFYSMFVISAKPDLVFSIPFVLYGIYRYWFIVDVKEEGESPTDVLYKDPQLILTIMGWASICLYSLWPEVKS